jgi:ABC-type multidrug transport system ATPase subunit
MFEPSWKVLFASRLTVLAAACRGVKMQGEVLYNGKPLNKRAKRQVGYVMQDDLLYESLTVYETLYFAALLRLPRQMSKAAKLERVSTVITALGLDKCKNTIIGSYFRRGISGGERKRVSVGHELLINPSIVLLDEPTSGLDSTTALQLVESLRALASGGRAIITTIHQPSSRLYQLLDKLMLLCDGHVMYYGKAHMAADWFHKLGFTLPYGTNVADFILDLASGAILTDERSGDDSKTYLIEYSERYLSQGDAVVNGYREGQDVCCAPLSA